MVHTGIGFAQAVGDQGVCLSLWVDVTRENLEEVTFMLSLRSHTEIHLGEERYRG